MTYAKGYIPSLPDERGLGHPRFLATITAIPAQASVEAPVVDQLQLGSCTGNACAVAIMVEMSGALGLPPGHFVELPSRLFLYYAARALEGSSGSDVGAMISDIWIAAAKLGFPPESAWTYPLASSSPAEQLHRCTTEPDTMAFHAAADQKILKGAYRLETTGQDLSDDIARAIALGSVVVWGTELDQAFEDLVGPQVWPGVTGAVIGGHAMYLRAYKPDPARAHRRIYASPSSWGVDFADRGTAWVAQDAIESSHASEFWVVSLSVPLYSMAGVIA